MTTPDQYKQSRAVRALDADIAATNSRRAKPLSKKEQAAMNSIAGNGDASAIKSVAGNVQPGAISLIVTKPAVWPEPTPLPNALPPVQAFDAELMPLALRARVMNIAHRMQCPPDFLAVGTLVALSSLIGARAVVRPKARDDWQVVPNLWGVVVGRPGVLKSPALAQVLEPLNELEAAALQAWQQRHNEWELDCKADAIKCTANEKKVRELAAKAGTTTADYREKSRELLKPGDAQAEPTAQRYVVNDATVEKLGVLLSENPWGLLAYRDEIFGLLTSLDKQGQEGSRAFYLQAYDGNQGYTVDRIGRPKVHIPRVCFALLGGITPGRVQEYVRGAVAGGSGDDGLLQRFSMAVWPEVGPYVYVDQYPDFAAKEAVKTVIARLAGLEPVNDAEPQVWRFDDAAQALFAEWLTDFENEIRSHELHPAMVSHLAKYRKLIPALALQFALIDTPDSGCKIGEPELIRALGWGDYLRTHAVRLYAAATIPEITGADFLLSKLKAGKLSADGEIVDGFTPRQVAQKGWTGLTSTDDVRKAADVLADYDWLRRELVPGGAAGGRPSDRYLIHPSVLQKGKL